MNTEHLQYPIGRFDHRKNYSAEEIKGFIQDISILPEKVREIAERLSLLQASRSYRNGGWTAQQLINHLCDVYINAYMRTKWLLTESQPVIKPYDQDAFALLPDANFAPELSLTLFDYLIRRWVFILENTSDADYLRTSLHPEGDVVYTLGELVAMYAWHGKHHLAHLKIIAAS